MKRDPEAKTEKKEGAPLVAEVQRKKAAKIARVAVELDRRAEIVKNKRERRISKDDLMIHSSIYIEI